MDLQKMKQSTNWFGVTDFKSVDDPSGQLERKELVVSLDQYPVNFSLGPNPREPMLNTGVSKLIAATLNENHRNFHLLNRGITIVAKSAEYDNKTKRVRLRLHESAEEERHFGILDGGNTNMRINMWRQELCETDAHKLRDAYVNIQVLVPKGDVEELPSADMEQLLNDLKEARNTSVQVKAKSLADARRHFEDLKSILSKQPYYSRISWHEGQPGNIDGQDIISLLIMFYPAYLENSDSEEPTGAYGQKSRCLEQFINFAKTQPEELRLWIRIVPDLLQLFDEIQFLFPSSYSGHFGKISEVRIYDESKYEPGNKTYRKTAVKTRFLEREMKYSFPIGYIYPIFAAFRVLATEHEGAVIWRKEPIEFWKRHAKEIVRQFQPHMRQLEMAPKKIASSVTSYQAARHAVSDCFKDELLSDAGVEL